MKINPSKRWIVPIAFGVGFVVVNKLSERSLTAEVPETSKISKQQEAASYFTCPMHPQVRSDKPGDCPICHMKLVHFKTNAASHSDHAKGASASTSVQAMDSQMKLLATQKVAVERMKLVVEIPISVRFISQTSVAFQVYESDLYLLQAGLKLQLTSPSNPNQKLNGKIVSVDSIVDATSRTVRVVGSVAQSSKNIPSEATASGTIQIELEDRLAVPVDAVLHTGSETLVYQVDDKNTLTPRPVVLGAKAQSYYEVLDGLKVGDIVSSGANFLIDSEAKIRGAGLDHSNH